MLSKSLIFLSLFVCPEALAAAGGGCTGKLDAIVAYGQGYKFTDSAVSKGIQYSGSSSFNYGPAAGYACIGLGISGNSAQEKYLYSPTDADARSVTFSQTGIGLQFSAEVDIWRFIKSLQDFFISPIVGVEVQAGLAFNKIATDIPDVAILNSQNGTFTSYGMRVGARVQLFGKIGMQLGVLQGMQTYRFSGASVGYQVLRYEVGLSAQVGK